MEHRHLWLRTPRQSAILRVRATIMRAAAEYFDTNGFIRTDPPILTPNACEGTSDLFEMDYFDEDMAYLTQSGQLYIEATALALGKVYSFGPTFRAEKSKTRRHLTEFWMIEPEVAYMDLDGLMDLAENFLTHIVTRVLEPHRADLKVIGRDITKLEAVIATPGEFPQAHLRRSPRHARSRLQGRQARKPAHLRRRLRLPRRNLHHLPIRPSPSWSTATPPPSRPSTCSPTPTTPPRPSASTSSPPKATAKSSAARQRIDDYDLLKSRIESHNLPLAAFQWYLDLRKYGSVPHSGFGMGIERCVAWICGLDHVRETIPFARTLNRIYP